MLLLGGAWWEEGECKVCNSRNTYNCLEEMCTTALHEGAFWDAMDGRCRMCTWDNTYYCPEEMCTADLHEGALPHIWQCDP